MSDSKTQEPVVTSKKASGRKQRVVVCGGGNGSHAMMALASAQKDKFEVSVLTLWADEAERWGTEHDKQGGTVALRDAEKILGRAHKITKQPEEVIPQADVIVFIMPAFGHQIYLEAIKPHLAQHHRDFVLASMPAEGGFDFACRHTLGPDIMKRCTLAATETLPWATRVVEYGKTVEILGTKKQVDIAVAPRSKSEDAIAVLQSMVGPVPQLCKLDNFLVTTLMNINSVWHPTITYGAYRAWDFHTPFDKPLLFYEGVDDFTAQKLTDVSNEVLQAKAFLQEKYNVNLDGLRHVKEWMKRSYDGDMKDETNLRTMINSNKGYRGLTHPMTQTQEGKWMPNFKYRYMSEDIPFGLVVTRGICELCGIATPHMDEVIGFAEKALQKEFLVAGKLKGKDLAMTRAPQVFGITSLDQLMETVR